MKSLPTDSKKMNVKIECVDPFKILVDRGYRKFPVPQGKHADLAYQLCVRSDNNYPNQKTKIKKLYFINVYIYQRKVQYNSEGSQGYGRCPIGQEGYQLECQFIDEDGLTFDVSLCKDIGRPIEQMEGFFEKMYHNMNCIPYDDRY